MTPLFKLRRFGLVVGCACFAFGTATAQTTQDIYRIRAFTDKQTSTRWFAPDSPRLAPSTQTSQSTKTGFVISHSTREEHIFISTKVVSGKKYFELPLTNPTDIESLSIETSTSPGPFMRSREGASWQSAAKQSGPVGQELVVDMGDRMVTELAAMTLDLQLHLATLSPTIKETPSLHRLTALLFLVEQLKSKGYQTSVPPNTPAPGSVGEDYFITPPTEHPEYAVYVVKETKAGNSTYTLDEISPALPDEEATSFSITKQYRSSVRDVFLIVKEKTEFEENIAGQDSPTFRLLTVKGKKYYAGESEGDVPDIRSNDSSVFLRRSSALRPTRVDVTRHTYADFAIGETASLDATIINEENSGYLVGTYGRFVLPGLKEDEETGTEATLPTVHYLPNTFRGKIKGTRVKIFPSVDILGPEGSIPGIRVELEATPYTGTATHSLHVGLTKLVNESYTPYDTIVEYLEAKGYRDLYGSEEEDEEFEEDDLE